MTEVGELHLHKCGWAPTIDDEQHGKGCGHVFAHVKPDPDSVTSEDYDRGHLCPVCMAGPWKNVWEQETEDHWNSLTPEERQEVRDDVARKDAIWALLDRLFGAMENEDAETYGIQVRILDRRQR